jgi:hypothetical protein
MANEVTLNVQFSATNTAGTAVAHSTGARQFDMDADVAKQDVYKTSFNVTTSFTTIPHGDCAYANLCCVTITNKAAKGSGNFLYVSHDSGSTQQQKVPPGGTAVIWVDPALGTSTLQVKHTTALPCELTISETAAT